MPNMSPRGINLVQAETFELEPSSAKTTGTNAIGTNQWTTNGERGVLEFLLKVPAAGTLAGDTLDVFIDCLSGDGLTWLNTIHFPQVLGNGGAVTYFGVLDGQSVPSTTYDATADCAVGVTRPATFGTAWRVRYTIVNGGGTHSFTFGVWGLGKGGV